MASLWNTLSTVAFESVATCAQDGKRTSVHRSVLPTPDGRLGRTAAPPAAGVNDRTSQNSRQRERRQWVVLCRSHIRSERRSTGPAIGQKSARKSHLSSCSLRRSIVETDLISYLRMLITLVELFAIAEAHCKSTYGYRGTCSLRAKSNCRK